MLALHNKMANNKIFDTEKNTSVWGCEIFLRNILSKETKT